MATLVARGHTLEVAWHGPGPSQAATLVFLHEGLGCVAMWRDFPARVAEATGLGALVYSRWGYGGSDPVTPPRPLDYMQREGEETLPELLDAAGVREAILIGHSDGASIAIVHAATDRARRVKGVVLEAPHVFVEDVSVASIARAAEAYRTTDLRARLARHHGHNVDGAFWGWNRAWLDADFRAWNIEAYLPRVRVPVLAIQGEDDEYGTIAQIEAVERGVAGEVERCLLPACGHAPHRDQPEATLEAIVRWHARCFPAMHDPRHPGSRRG